MAHDEELAQRWRVALEGEAGISEKRMMGGICFFVNGNMLGGARADKEGWRRFMFRVGKDREAEALARPGASIVEMGGRKMGGMVFVDGPTCDDASLAEWVAMTLEFGKTLPAK